MKYGTQRRAWWLRAFKTSLYIFAHTEQKWTAKMASKRKEKQKKKSYPFQFCHQSSTSSRSASPGSNYKKCGNLVTRISTSPEVYLLDLVSTLPSSVTDMQKRLKNILKAQTVAATLMQPCLARNTLLYHCCCINIMHFLT